LSPPQQRHGEENRAFGSFACTSSGSEGAFEVACSKKNKSRFRSEIMERSISEVHHYSLPHTLKEEARDSGCAIPCSYKKQWSSYDPIMSPSNEPSEERPRKRQRFDNATAPQSLTDINKDCLVYILSYLPLNDMNAVAICSRQCNEARRDESLNQSRSGTIVCGKKSSIRSLCNTMFEHTGDWTFQYSTGHLRILDVTRLEGSEISRATFGLHFAWMTGVTSIDLSSTLPFTCITRQNVLSQLYRLIGMFTNLRELDLSYVSSPCGERVSLTIRNLVDACPRLSKLTWKGARNDNLNISGHGVEYIRELCVDNALFDCHENRAQAYVSTEQNYYLWRTCPKLERISMKNVSWRVLWDMTSPNYRYKDEVAHLIPQEAIIKFVRLHPRLRWLRSDLTTENVAMLKQERPEITFVS